MVMYDSKAPGVYIEEISGGARPIQAVGTSTAGFVGYVLHPTAPKDDAVAVNNWLEFERKFRVDPASELRRAEDALTRAAAEVERTETALKEAGAATKEAGSKADATTTAMLEAKRLAAEKAVEDAKAAQEKAKGVLEAAKQYVTQALGAGSPSTPLTQAVYGFFLNGGTRCYIANVGNGQATDDAKVGAVKKGLGWLEKRDEIAIVAAPGYTGTGYYTAVLDHCEKLGDRVAILDPAKDVSDTDDLIDTSKKRPRSSSYGTFYYPWILVRDPFNGKEAAVPPSGHLAGVWARTDAERGVHKAPANTPIRGAVGLTAQVADDEQGQLNQAGVNCIRFFSADGILVWGARTLTSDPEWRYLNVRRLLNMIEESIEESTRWAVFEPNDAPLWAALRRDVSAFLTRIWRTGALRGSTPEQAFFVKCDEETNPTENIDAGIVTTVIGVAPVKPAEYVVFQIRQYQPGSEVETQGG